MKVGPSEPPCGGRLQTATCCVGWRPSWWARWKRRTWCVRWGPGRRCAAPRWRGRRWRVVTER